MKNELLKRWNGKYCSINEISENWLGSNQDASRKTIIWNVNDLVKQGKVVRVGKGVYYFAPKEKFEMKISDVANKACSVFSDKLPYLEETLVDTSGLGELMNLLPFFYIISFEVSKIALEASLSVLRKEGMDAYAKKDFLKMEPYIATSHPIILRPKLSMNPSLPSQNNLHFANLEKILVDLVCDKDIYGQYQDSELQNIYQNATERYAVNYSQMTRYATLRKRKEEVIKLLSDTEEYQKVRELL